MTFRPEFMPTESSAMPSTENTRKDPKMVLEAYWESCRELRKQDDRQEKRPWICPVCGAGVAPFVTVCPICSPKVRGFKVVCLHHEPHRHGEGERGGRRLAGLGEAE